MWQYWLNLQKRVIYFISTHWGAETQGNFLGFELSPDFLVIYCTLIKSLFYALQVFRLQKCKWRSMMNIIVIPDQWISWQMLSAKFVRALISLSMLKHQPGIFGFISRNAVCFINPYPFKQYRGLQELQL